jgi:hypothetical protein
MRWPSVLFRFFCCSKRTQKLDRPNNIYLNGNKGASQNTTEIDYPLVLTPSEAGSVSEFQFPSPPKKQADVPVFVFENNELQRKLTKRLDKIEKINAGEEEPFERDQLSPTKIEVLDLEKRGINVKEVLKTEEPVEFSETIEKNKVVEILEDDVEKRQNNIEKGQDNVETVQENVEKWQGNVEELEDKVTIDTTEEIFIEPEQFQLKIENNLKDELLVQSSENSPLPIQISKL